MNSPQTRERPLFAAELDDIKHRIERTQHLVGERIVRAVVALNSHCARRPRVSDEEQELHEHILIDAAGMLREVWRMRTGLAAVRLAVRAAIEQTPNEELFDPIYDALERAENCIDLALLDEPTVRARLRVGPTRVLANEVAALKRAERAIPDE